jgi:MFS family permease
MRAVANHRHSRMRHRVRRAAARYRDARRSLRTPASLQSRRGLDWTNFFIADAQTAFGAFVAVYLAQAGWSEGGVGLALATGTIAGVASQLPGGALADAVRWKRGLAALGILMIASAALILAFTPRVAGVFTAEILQGSTAGVITPAITAISLGLVGRQAISVRAGRNYRYAAAGGAVTAALMGALGSYLSGSAIFLFAAALCVPALIALSRIRGEEIDYAKARNAGTGAKAAGVASILDLAKNHRLVLFAGALMLFQLADASMLPLIGENLAVSWRGYAAITVSGLIIVPQIVVAVLAPWVGLHCELKGRRPLLVLGFGLEPIRAILLALATGYGLLIVAQILSGITGAVIGVLTVLVIADLTAGTGRFNLAVGAVGALSGIAASISTSTTGFLFQALGPRIGYLPLAAIAAAATGVLWVFLAETKPEKYEE